MDRLRILHDNIQFVSHIVVEQDPDQEEKNFLYFYYYYDSSYVCWYVQWPVEAGCTEMQLPPAEEGEERRRLAEESAAAGRVGRRRGRKVDPAALDMTDRDREV